MDSSGRRQMMPIVTKGSCEQLMDEEHYILKNFIFLKKKMMSKNSLRFVCGLWEHKTRTVHALNIFPKFAQFYTILQLYYCHVMIGRG